MPAVVLRHRDATRQSVLYGVFGAGVAGLMVFAFAASLTGKWFMLILLPAAVFLGYSSVRLATLRVRLDEHGVWEPNPFALTYVTPWSDVQRVRKVTHQGAMHLRFIGVEIVHADGDAHELAALKMQAGAVEAEPAIERWIAAILEAKRAAATSAE